MDISATWVFTAVIGGAVLALGRLLDKDMLSIHTGIQLAITSFTGFWYAIRFHYTKEIGAPHSGTIGKLFTMLIALAGLAGFYLVGRPDWFVAQSVVLALGTQKDLEIILGQRRLRREPLSKLKGWRSRLIEMHHWYSAVRDVSMAAWWAIYGVLENHPPAGSVSIDALFGFPYLFLVVLWCVVKERTHETEATLWTKGG